MASAPGGGPPPAPSAGGSSLASKKEAAKALLKTSWLKTRSVLTNKSKIELLVEDATNLEPWGPTGPQMHGAVCDASTEHTPVEPASSCSGKWPRGQTATQHVAPGQTMETLVLRCRAPTASWAPSSLCAEVAEACFDAEKFRQAWGVLLRRFESEPEHWRRVYKARPAVASQQLHPL